VSPKDQLREALQDPLPGAKAHSEVWPPNLPARPADPGRVYRSAAVLLALIPGENESFSIPLIKRPSAMPNHPGQIGLPGGEAGEGEGLEACALRESFEEIGLDPGIVEILGRLTPVPVSASGFLIAPFVGWVKEAPPSWTPGRAEVEQLLLCDPDRLALDGPTALVERERDGLRWKVPAFSVEEEKVWGATALILAEFLTLWRTIRGLAGPDS
jgi:8-oxo-dGTP pyrophosphatase MutT (NUDIX family)